MGTRALLPAMFAFRLHQHIAYGGTFGEWQTFGATAWLTGAALWWAGWVIGISPFGESSGTTYASSTMVEIKRLCTAGRAPLIRLLLQMRT